MNKNASDKANMTAGELIAALSTFDPSVEVVSCWDSMEMPCYGVLAFQGKPVLLVDEYDTTVEDLIEWRWK